MDDSLRHHAAASRGYSAAVAGSRQERAKPADQPDTGSEAAPDTPK